MQNTDWAKAAATGAGAGAVVLAIAGFTWGGWVTGGTAHRMADNAARDARTEVVASLCVHNFAAGPDAKGQLAKLKETRSYERDNFIEDGGWANIPGLEDGMRGVANACADRLVAMEKLPDPAAAQTAETNVSG